MTSKKITISILIAIVLLAGAFAISKFRARETPDKAAEELAAQNIELSENGFIAEINAGHADNVRRFIIGGMHAGSMDAAGEPAVVAAAKHNDSAILSLLLSSLQPGDAQALQELNAQDADGNTALLIAVQMKNSEIVKMLISYGADVLTANKQSQTPLLLAVKNGEDDLVPLLLETDVKQHRTGVAVNRADSTGDTPIIYAIKADKPPMVKTLINARADAVSGDLQGITPLMVAAETGDIQIGQALIDAGAKLNTADARRGDTPLTIAIAHRHPEFAKFLIAKGADPDFHTTGPLPIQVAIETEPFDSGIFTFLLARTKQLDAIASSLLFEAVDRKNADMVKVLLDAGLNPKITNAQGESLLYHAIETGEENTVIVLIDKNVDVTQSGVVGITPLERAAKRNEIKVVQKILDAGVSPDQKTSEGYTVAEMAVYRGYPEILAALLAKGARIEKDFGLLWSIRDGGGKSVPVLLDYGANPNVTTDNGDPALWLAASLGEVEAVKSLIAHHAALSFANRSQSMTPLAIAAHTGHLDIVRLLVEAGAKLEAKDASGMTPLAHAALMTKPDVVDYLLSRHADPHSLDSQGRSVLDLAGLASASDSRDKVFMLLQRQPGRPVPNN